MRCYNLFKGEFEVPLIYSQIRYAGMNLQIAAKTGKSSQYPQNNNQLHASESNLHFYGQELFT